MTKNGDNLGMSMSTNIGINHWGSTISIAKWCCPKMNSGDCVMFHHVYPRRHIMHVMFNDVSPAHGTVTAGALQCGCTITPYQGANGAKLSSVYHTVLCNAELCRLQKIEW